MEYRAETPQPIHRPYSWEPAAPSTLHRAALHVSLGNRKILDRLLSFVGQPGAIQQYLHRNTVRQMRPHPLSQLRQMYRVNRLANSGRPDIRAQTRTRVIFDKGGAS